MNLRDRQRGRPGCLIQLRSLLVLRNPGVNDRREQGQNHQHQQHFHESKSVAVPVLPVAAAS